MTSPVKSSQDFIRALKATSDPPQPGWPSKINIASQAWDQSTFYIPNKGQVIADWILTRLLKGKSKDGESNLILDLDHWLLLANIVSPLHHHDDSQSIHSWLVPLLNRTPIIPIIITYFNILPSLSCAQRESLSVPFLRCFRVLWPLAVQKVNSDTLLDCFGAFLGLLVAKQDIIIPNEDECLATAGSMLILSYKTALFNSTNKKKLYTTFTANHLQTWLICTLSANRHPFIADAYNAGVETLFSVDVLRQMTEGNAENHLLDALSKFSVPTVFLALPPLFLSFCQAIRKSRGSLFGQVHDSGSASSSDLVHSSGMKFYVSCNSLLQLGETSPKEVWKTRTALLKIVDQERLFGSVHAPYNHVLGENVQQAAIYLQTHQHEPELTELVFQTLCVLATIDSDVVVPSFRSILPVLAKTPITAPSASAFLELLLDYHAKTRTVPTYLLNLLDSLGFEPLQMADPQEVYQIVFAGPVFEPVHLDLLTRSVNNSVTPGQCLDLVGKTGEMIRHTWGRFQEIHGKLKADLGDGARKKRKLDETVTTSEAPQPFELAALSVSFSFLCRLVGVIWTSIPIKSIADDVKSMIRESIDTFRTDVILPCLKGMKYISGKSERKGLDTWPLEVAAASALRLQYVLAASRRLEVEPFEDEKINSRMVKILSSGDNLPELQAEIARFFLSQACQNKLSNFEDVFNFILDQIELLPETEAVQWMGRSSELAKGQKEQSAVALLHILVARWLPVIEGIATATQLERFIRVLLRSRTFLSPQCLSGGAISPSLINRMALRSAEFWELANLRNVILSYVVRETSALDQIDLLHALEMLQRGSLVATTSVNVRQTVLPYEALLFAPLEYFSKNARTDLLRRALTADVILTTSSLIDKECDADEISRMQTILREFLNRLFLWLNAVEYPAVYEISEYLVNSRWVCAPSTQEESTETTLKLVELHFSALVKLAGKGQSEGLLRIIQRLLVHKAFEPSGAHFGQKVIVRFLDIITKSAFVVQASSDVIESLRALSKSLTSCLETRLSQVISGEGVPGNSLDTQLVLTEAWCKTLGLRRLLQINDQIPQFGTAIVRKALSLEASVPRAESLIGPCKSAISVLLAELQGCPIADRERTLQVTIAAQISLYRLCGYSDLNELDSTLASACDFLSAVDLSYILDFSLESLYASGVALQDLGPLIRLTSVLLHQAPEGTMKICQQFTTRCINLFLDRATFWKGSPSLRLTILAFVSSACNNRPASIRSGDVTCIWTILSKLLVGTEAHDETTSVVAFNEIVTIISALIRLRRDLVLLTLPHLGMILRQLVMAIRGIRPQLGAKQSKIITDTFPSWINPSQPLAQEEAKGLARLFASLTAKTVVRVFGSSSDVQKAESLARPFGKHASYVLVAYIEAMNDPLCVISADVRKELYPGLFALCDMLNDYDREALMLSALDSGGKVTMKALWKEYEKQKYVGMG